jgi:hypothetical protein
MHNRRCRYPPRNLTNCCSGFVNPDRINLLGNLLIAGEGGRITKGGKKRVF